MRIEKFCRVTKVENPIHLRASHCKPWRDSTNAERLNGENGLLLTPTIDHLFDRGFISFEDAGRLIISPVAHNESLRRMGIDTEQPVNVGVFSQGQPAFLDYHRNSVLPARYADCFNISIEYSRPSTHVMRFAFAWFMQRFRAVRSPSSCLADARMAALSSALASCENSAGVSEG
jgi:hypothetical protein